jgi:lipid-A-disaccharide synthase
MIFVLQKSAIILAQLSRSDDPDRKRGAIFWASRYDGCGYCCPNKDKLMPSSIFISAGEASGELYGSLLVSALRRQLAAKRQTAEFFGMGGVRMEAAGLERVVRAEDMAVMGLTEVVRHLPRIYREYGKLKQAIRARKPAVAVLIDFPGLHFKLAEVLHREGVPVVYFVSPQLWAWKKGRIKKVRKFVRRMLVIFPFEETFYREHGVKAEFVGHPLAELVAPDLNRERFAREHGLDLDKTWIGLLPGSRPKEIRDLLPEMLRAAERLAAKETAGVEDMYLRAVGPDFDPDRKFPKSKGPSAAEAHDSADPISLPSFSATYESLLTQPMSFTDAGCEFLIPLASTLNAAQRDEVRQIVDAYSLGMTVRLVEDARAVLFHARVSVVASGTATVEAALIGNPFVVVYRVSPLTYAIAKRLVKVPHVAMVNLIAGKRVVPELIQSDFSAENIVQQIESLLPDGPARQSMMQELAEIRGLLHIGRAAGSGEDVGAIERVAEIVLESISR